MTTPTAGPAGEPALVLDALVRRFGSVTAVDGLSMGVARGSLVALLGPNGAGKTSTLDVCTGFARPDGGSVRVLGSTPGDAAGRSGRASVSCCRPAARTPPPGPARCST